MSPWSVLLRVMLAVALVLNGTMAAAASVTMMRAPMPQSASAAVHAASQRPAMQADAPCHDMARMTATALSPDAGAVTPSGHAPQGKGKSPAADCCKSGTCQCACTQAAQAALAATLAFGLDSPHSDVAHPMLPGHADPALPHLVRPPIG